MQIFFVLLCLFFTCEVSGNSTPYFKKGFELGLIGNKKFSPKRQETKNGLKAGKALREKKLGDGKGKGLKFKAPSDFDTWINLYQKAITEDDKLTQEMLIAALGSRVTIKIKGDYKKSLRNLNDLL